MISHLTLGTNNLELAIKYYDQLLKLFGAKQIAKTDQVVFYAFADSSTKFAITKPYDGHVATSGNGTMLALKAPNEQLVNEAYNLAINLGSECEGQPGPRDNGAYTAAYFRDLDGNKLVVFYRPDK
ncbi:glyoxalase [Pseudoalteromonas luteoviolacea]|uniref:Glyoxalase n=1 Tax=Pseudoalteromonas luteoviolacea TaxID=43657 RepID=A0A1C0TSN8_9GAMM|nr:VOC family protein [Pseudoalteromonas luteoviolacea]OCQ22243.1 glyoxalase [Pseudoalteromonas luteoviolacea]